MTAKKLTHVDSKGKASMVDIGTKKDQLRIATASGLIKMKPETLNLIRENGIKKGDVLTVAEVAGIQGGKLTATLIPLCHPLPVTRIEVETKIEKEGVRVTAEARCIGKTGVEMEALTSVAVSLLTIYDMCKAVDKEMSLTGIRLLEKTKSDIE
jgi:cyclic pyranopterin phosphate synthase